MIYFVFSSEDSFPSLGAVNEDAVGQLFSSPPCNAEPLLSSTISVGDSSSQHSFSSRPAESENSSRQPVVAVVGPMFIARKENLAHLDTNRDDTAQRRTMLDEETAVKQRIGDESDFETASKLRMHDEADEETAVKQIICDAAGEETALKHRMSSGAENDAALKVQSITSNFAVEETAF